VGFENFTPSFVRKLIHASDPIPVIWSRLKKIWNPAKYESIPRYYEVCEEKTLKLEKLLDITYPELYEEVLPRKCSRPKLENISPPIVWMDGMSIREAQLLIQDYNLSYEGFSFSALPSTTSYYREHAGIRDLFIIQDPENPALKRDEEMIWCKLPDIHLTGIKGNDNPRFREMYKKMKRAFENILQRLEAQSVTLLSDHGYFDVKRSQREKSEIEERMKEAFEDERFTVNEANDLVKKGCVIHHHDFYLIKGRRCWTKRGRYTRFPHGGLSLTECILPFIKLTK